MIDMIRPNGLDRASFDGWSIGMRALRTWLHSRHVVLGIFNPTPLLRAGPIAIVGALCSCSSVERLDRWMVLPESACSTFAASLAVDYDTLQSIVGSNFSPADLGDGRVGQLRLTFHECPRPAVSGRSDAAGNFAIVSVRLAEESLPVRIAGFEPNDWVSLLLYIGSGSRRSARLLSDGAFAVVNGESTLQRRPEDGGERVTAEITFENGRLAISAEFACEPTPVRRSQMVVGTGSERYSILFGDRLGNECSSRDVLLELVGETPFSDLGLTAHGATATKATGVVWDYRLLRNAQFLQ